EVVGGFDENMPSFELLDFWATALERGFRDVVLDEPLINYRVRAGSGYRRSIQPDVYRARLGHFYAKHRRAIDDHGLELVAAKEAFFISQHEYWRGLEERAAALSRELSELRDEIATTTQNLESREVAHVD